MCVCKENIGSSLSCDNCELTLGLFFLVSEITFIFLLTRDCRFAYCLVLIVDLSVTTVLLIIQSFILIPGVLRLKIA